MSTLLIEDVGTGALDLAREVLYRFLAACLTDPRGQAFELVRCPAARPLLANAAELLREEADGAPQEAGCGELPARRLDLGPLFACLDDESQVVRDFDRVFGLIQCRECPPYETEYCHNADTFYTSQQMADVAGFYRAFGLNLVAGRPERPDHVALELEFLSLLLTKKRLAREAAEPDADERVAVCEEAEQAFFREHLGWWLPAFATGLRKKAGDGFYAALADVLAALMPLERRRFHVPPPRLPLQPVSANATPEEDNGCAGCDLRAP